MTMKNSLFKTEDVLKFFEESRGVKFVDVDTGKPALGVVAENKKQKDKSDYDLWLEQQDNDVRKEYKMGAL